MEAGFVDRIMYGTDQIIWPGLIELGISAINDAPFLTHGQKKAILHDNAARFLRLQT
jgi:predicted TIM-barrel fold metal-dependent hydrolase